MSHEEAPQHSENSSTTLTPLNTLGSNSGAKIAEADSISAPKGRWKLIRDVSVLQLKLLLDGLLDAFMAPISLIALLIGLLVPNKRGLHFFYDVLKLAHKAESSIALFKTIDENQSHSPIDNALNKLGASIENQSKHPGSFQKIQHTVDHAVDAAQGVLKKKGHKEDI